MLHSSVCIMADHLNCFIFNFIQMATANISLRTARHPLPRRDVSHKNWQTLKRFFYYVCPTNAQYTLMKFFVKHSYVLQYFYIILIMHAKVTKLKKNYINNCPTRCNTKQSIYYSANSLCMFRVSTTPIIRSTQNRNYSLRYWSYFCAATYLQRGQASLASTGGCSYNFVYSWWWV